MISYSPCRRARAHTPDVFPSLTENDRIIRLSSSAVNRLHSPPRPARVFNGHLPGKDANDERNPETLALSMEACAAYVAVKNPLSACGSPSRDP